MLTKNWLRRKGGSLMRFYTEQHNFYCGIDLHAKFMYLCILTRKAQLSLKGGCLIDVRPRSIVFRHPCTPGNPQSSSCCLMDPGTCRRRYLHTLSTLLTTYGSQHRNRYIWHCVSRQFPSSRPGCVLA